MYDVCCFGVLAVKSLDFDEGRIQVSLRVEPSRTRCAKSTPTPELMTVGPIRLELKS